MNNAWVKLWEDTIYNEVWRYDPIAWKIFEYLLISAYRGQPQGTTVKTTQQITDTCFGSSGKNGTIYKAIKRLEKHGMVKTKSTNKKTEFKIVNWWEYQGKGSNGKNEVKTKSKPSNTLIRSKNKEVRNNTYKDYEEFLNTFNESMGKNYRATDKQYQKYKLRRKVYEKDELLKVARDISKIPFMRGDNDRGWQADQEYILRNDDNIDKILNNQTKRKVYEI